MSARTAPLEQARNSRASEFGYPRRIGYLLLSGLAGWLCAQIATLPTNVLIAVRNSGGDQHLFLQLLFFGGFIAWGAWTLILSLLAEVCVALPLVLLLDPRRLVRYRRAIYWLSALVAVGITLYKLHDFRDAAASSRFLRFFEALPYGIFAVAFSVTTAWVYLAIAKRRLAVVDGQR